MKRKQLAALFCASMLAVTGTMAPFTGMTTYAAEAAEETQSAGASVEDQTSAADAAAATDADQQEESEQEEEIETAAEPVEETEEIEEQAENTGADVVEEVSEDSDEDEDSESINTEETSEEGGTQQDAAAAVEEKIENEEGKEAAKGVTAIVLNETEIELKTDETFQLTASVNTEEGEAGAVQDYTIEWSSDNSRIAQVDDNGLVTAKKQGNTTIHASVEGYDENGNQRKEQTLDQLRLERAVGLDFEQLRQIPEAADRIRVREDALCLLVHLLILRKIAEFIGQIRFRIGCNQFLQTVVCIADLLGF